MVQGPSSLTPQCAAHLTLSVFLFSEGLSWRWRYSPFKKRIATSRKSTILRRVCGRRGRRRGNEKKYSNLLGVGDFSLNSVLKFKTCAFFTGACNKKRREAKCAIDHSQARCRRLKPNYGVQSPGFNKTQSWSSPVDTNRYKMNYKLIKYFLVLTSLSGPEPVFLLRRFRSP